MIRPPSGHPLNTAVPRKMRCSLIVGGMLLTAWHVAPAAGVSAYLPLNLEPEMERQIERVLILADEPILKRPFAVALVELALPQACEIDKPLCTRVRRYLERYSRDYALTHASVTGSLTHGEGVVPNQHGLPVDSNHELSIAAFVQPSDYFLLSAGAVSYSGRTSPTGSMLSVGTNWAQLDLGYRDHWLSPLTDSSSLMSTEAPTMPSATLSNYEPLTRLGFQYEFFWAKMSSNHILYNGVQAVGDPNLFGVQFSVEPFPGWSVGFNRMLQYGGGDGLPSTAHFLLTDFFKPSGQSQTQGNQQASYVSRVIIPTKTPFALYFQYAGEDNSDGGSYLLGNPMASAGIDFPRIFGYFDATYEISEWSNIWYVHSIYLDGMTNDGLVLGTWGADQRNFGDGVGARSMMLRVGWEPEFGGYLEERIRTLVNQTYYGGDNRTYVPPPPGAFPYHHYYDFSIRYSRPWNALTVGGEVFAGRDVYGKSFSRLSGFVRYGGDARTRDDGSVGDSDDDEAAGEVNHHGAEVFVDAGANANEVKINLNEVRINGVPVQQISTTPLNFGPHFAVGARRAVSDTNDLGARVELDQIDDHLLIGLRALDYRHRFDSPFTFSAFGGVARYNLATPATSIYAGMGGGWRNILPKWDLDLDLRYAQNVARDHLLATDPQGLRPDSFYKIESATLYLSRHF
ncbi:MAG: capsule assembly Wzi family protein [Steroidobacteraceae bacterium]